MVSPSHPRNPNDQQEESPVFIRGVEQHPFFQHVHYHQKEWARASQNALNELIRRKQIDPTSLRRIFEFGAGIGTSTIALSQLAKVCEAELDVAELDPDNGKVLVRSELVPLEGVFIDDGVATLRKLSRAGNRYDLIYAGMFAPDSPVMIEDFLRTAGAALAQDGKAVIYSDHRTMQEVAAVCHDIEATYYHIITNLDPDGHFRDVFVFSDLVF